MKKILLILGLISVILFPNTLFASGGSSDWMQYTYIAHALGGLGTDYHIDSIDAFNQSYQNGFKVFETDLLLTSDDKLVAVHDWSGYTTPPTYAQFMSSKVLGKYTPTDVDQILQLMETHPDMYLDTDTKETDPALITKQFNILVSKARAIDPSILNRIIPEIYNPQMYDTVQSIYHFPNYLYSIWLLGDTPQDRTEIINFMVQHHIKAMTISADRLDADYMKRLKEHGLYAYAYTVNDQQQVNKLKALGVHGVYTDFLKPPASETQSA